MTRKHYVMIAQAFADAGVMTDIEEDDPTQARKGIRQAAEFLASALYADNPRFDRARFLNACNLKG